MKVAVYSQYFRPESFLINQIVEDLAARGCEVIVITGKPNYPEGIIPPQYSTIRIQKEFMHGVEVIRVPIYPRKNGKSCHLILNYLSYIISASLYSCHLAFSRPKVDCIFSYGLSPIFQSFPAIILSLLVKKPLVLWVQDLWPESVIASNRIRNKHLIFVLRLLVRLVYFFPRCTLIQSPSFEKHIRNLSPSRSVITYLPNFYSPPNLHALKSSKKSLDFKKAQKLLKSKRSLIFSGNIGFAQSLETIILAAEQLRYMVDLQFVFIGSGSMHNQLKIMAASKKLDNVHFVGRFDLDEAYMLMQYAYAFILTLTSKSEVAQTVPSKFQCYLSLGKPIIASINGPSADLMKESGAGFISNAGDYVQMARDIESLVKLTKLEYRRLGENAKNFFYSNYTCDHIVSRLYDILKGSNDIA